MYVEAHQSLKEVKTLVDEVPAPLAFNIIPGGKTPPFEIGDMERLDVKYLSIPMICLYSATKAMVDSLRVLKEKRDVKRLAGMGVSWAEFNELVGVSRWRRLELEVLGEATAEVATGLKVKVSDDLISFADRLFGRKCAEVS